MAAAVRVGDPTGHGGTVVGPGAPTVLIGGRPAATVGTSHACGVPLHGSTAITGPGSTSVLIGGRPAARVGDVAGCGSPLSSGLASVQIGG